MRRVLADTGPLVAVLSRNDEHHTQCVEALRNVPGPLFSCWPVMTEAAWLLRKSPEAVQKLLQSLQSGFVELLPLAAADAKGIANVIKRYGSLQPQLADATLVYLALRDGIDTVFTLDRRDFSIYRLARGRPFRILP